MNDTILWGHVAEAGHLSCAGWQFIPETGVVICACGTNLGSPPAVAEGLTP